MILIDEQCHRHILSDDDAAMIASSLSTSYTWLLDAWANCAGEGHGYNWPAQEPRDVSGHIAKADRIEAICAALGHPLRTERRRSVEAYYARISEKWWLDHLLDSHGQP